jgi:uncharacterized membrane protein
MDLCPLCDGVTGVQLRAALFDEHFWPSLFATMSPLMATLLAVSLTTRRPAQGIPGNPSMQAARLIPQHRRVERAGIVLGIGLGGFIDGILFHQILQIHNMMSARIPRSSVVNVDINMFWDGMFHAFTWAMTCVGILLLWRALSGVTAQVRPIGLRSLVGAMLIGWGLFNLIEGIIDHQLLRLHHVVELASNHLIGDSAFLLFGAALVLCGRWQSREALRALDR